MRQRHQLPVAGCLIVVLAGGCSEEGPIQPDQSSNLDVELSALSVQSIGFIAAELLADPLLRDMLEALQDQRRASRITEAVDATYESLTQDDLKTAQRHLDGAYRALEEYLGRRDVGDADVIHLDASERFLDEVEAMIDSGD